MKYTADKPYISLEIQKPTDLFGFTALASRYFMTAGRWDDEIDSVLKKLMQATLSSRISIYRANTSDENPGSEFQLIYSVADHSKKSLLPAQPQFTKALQHWKKQFH